MNIKSVLLFIAFFIGMNAYSQQTDSTKQEEDLVDGIIFTKTEVPVTFPGGEKAFKKFLNKNLNSDIALQNQAPQGTYTVFIRFFVSKKGIMSHLVPLTKHGYGMEEEAIRVLKLSEKWKPAKQNGRIVNAYVLRQPITFVVK